MVDQSLNERGLRDGLTALTDIVKTVAASERRAEMRMAEAEADLIAARKVHSYVKGEIEVFKARLRAIEDAKKA